MSPDRVEAGLIPRLERLSGREAAGRLPEYRRSARGFVTDPRFSTALRRARALSDPGRMTAVALLRRRAELCACELQAALGLTHATVSHHMRVLEEAGLVRSQRRGKWVYYRLDRPRGIDIP